MIELIIDKTTNRRRTRTRWSKTMLAILAVMACAMTFYTTYMNAKYDTTAGATVTVNIRNPRYTIRFHSNEAVGNDSTYTQQCTYGLSCTLTPLYTIGFTNSGYSFKWWNTASDNSGTSYGDAQPVMNLSSTEGAVIDLYAQWVPDFTVTGNAVSWTNQDVTLTVVLGGGESPSNYQYSFDGGATWQSSDNMTFSSNQDVHIMIKSNNGYYTSAEKVESITKIDKVTPVMTFDNSIEYNTDHSTNQVTTLIAYLGDNTSIMTGVNPTDDLSGIATGWPKCYRNNSEINSTNTLTSVGRYAITCKVQDNAGNETTENREVLIRWPLAGRYVVTKTTIDGAGIAGTGLSVSTSTNGLFMDDATSGADASLPFASKYYYTGPVVDNYISFAGTTFRILNVSTNDDVKLLGDVSDVQTAWGDSKIYDSNTYNTWSTKWWPRGQIYNNETGETRYKVFTETEKAHLDLATFYVGRLDNNSDNVATMISNERTDTTSLGGNESSSFVGYSAYPNVSDFMKASKTNDTISSLSAIDMTTVYSTRQRFSNNSWIDMTTEYWTMNGRTGSLLQNGDFWVIDNDQGGHFESRSYYNHQQYRVVFYLKYNTILSGSGSNADPYLVQEDWAWFDSYQAVQ